MQVADLPALQITGLHKRFGPTSILCGLDMTVRQGEHLGIIGANGSGKSTLFDLISGRCLPCSGQIWLNGHRIDGQTPRHISRMGLSRSFQTSHLFPRLSVLDHLLCAVLPEHGHPGALSSWFRHTHGVRDRVHALMTMVQLDAQSQTLAMHLSHADQRALELALALAPDAPVILLDEPAAGLSLPEADRMVRLIRDATTGKTLLIIEHNMGVVSGLADKIAVLVHGRLQAADDADTVRAHAAH